MDYAKFRQLRNVSTLYMKVLARITYTLHRVEFVRTNSNNSRGVKQEKLITSELHKY